MSVPASSSARVEPTAGQVAGPSAPVSRVRGAWLMAAALASFGLVAAHLAAIVIGLPAYEFMTAPRDMILLAQQGSIRPALVTLVVSAVFALFGLYALSGAGRARTLPVLRIGLIFISTVFLLRGLLLFPEIVILTHTGDVPRRALAFSFVSLCIATCYIVGTARRWPYLPTSRLEDDPE